MSAVGDVYSYQEMMAKRSCPNVTLFQQQQQRLQPRITPHFWEACSHLFDKPIHFHQHSCALAVYGFEQKTLQVSRPTLMRIRGSLFKNTAVSINSSNKIMMYFTLSITSLWTLGYFGWTPTVIKVYAQTSRQQWRSKRLARTRLLYW